jgi:hypothetical protein
MLDLWTTLVPLLVASAILPFQITVTMLLLRSAAGPAAGIAWVAGLATVRLVQGLVFGVILTAATEAEDDTQGPGAIVSTLLIVVGVVFLATALRTWLKQPDEDAPTPAWMDIVASASPGRAFLMGIGAVAIGAKLWAFTLAALGAIADAELGPAAATATYLVFVAGALSVHLTAMSLVLLTPDRAGAALDRISDLLRRYDRVLMAGLATVFGVWLLVKGLVGLQVI